MRFTPRQLVARGLPLLEGPLAPDRPERLDDVPDVVPASARFASFEVRLVGAHRVDFAVVLEAQVARRALLGPPSAAPDPSWAPTRALLTEWNDPVSPLHRGVGEVWLTWDLEGPPGSPVRHLPYVGPRVGGRRARRQAWPAWIDAVRRAIALLGPTTARWEAVLDALPPGAEVGLVASLAPRGRDAVRFTLALQGAEVSPFLARIGWPGDLGWVGATIDGLALARRWTPIQVDVTPAGVAPRITVECCWHGTPAEAVAWRPVLDALGAAGVAGDRVEAVARWPSPACPLPVAPELQVSRMLDVKLTHEPGRPVEPKAYLGFAPLAVLFA